MSALLEQAEQRADPLADDTVAAILGPWPELPATASAAECLAAAAGHLQRVATLNRLLAQWTDNASLAAWPSQGAGAGTGAGAETQAVPPELAAPLQAYLQAGRALPPWADPAQLARAEALFMDYGALSCVLLFCASLPECYVVPDLSAVLHVAGQLEQHTDYRIRVTAAMIFPVMLHGGLATPEGSGVAQVLKVRLIHATIRNLILRGHPAGHPVREPLPALQGAQDLHQALLAHGWDSAADGLPCNQEELAYTLLTFGYVFLRSLRKLGLGLAAADEQAYLHTWNVVGHVLGIERGLMVESMEQGEALFARMQALGRAQPRQPDPRPGLGRALMQAMEQAIPFRALRPLPVLMTRHLCGAQVMGELGIAQRVGWLPRALFALGMGLARAIDAVVRLARPEFALSRLLARVLGYHLLTKLLLDQTRPLRLPPRLLNQVGGTVEGWCEDPKAGRWLNALEDRLTTRGRWSARRPGQGRR